MSGVRKNIGKTLLSAVHCALRAADTVFDDFFCMRWLDNRVLMFHFSRVDYRFWNKFIKESLSS